MVAFSTLVLLGFMAWCVYVYINRTKANLPGPKGMPFFGHYFEMRNKSGHNDMLELVQKYGPVIGIRAFGQTTVMLLSASVIREALISTKDNFWTRPKRYRSKKATDNFKNIISQQNRKIHKDLRKSIHTTLKVYGEDIRAVEKVISKGTDHIITKLNQLVLVGQPQNIYQDIYASLVQIICELAFGVNISTDDPIITALKRYEVSSARVFQSTFSYVMYDWFPWLEWIPGFEPYKDMMENLSAAENLWQRHIEPMVAKYGETPGTAYYNLKQLEGKYIGGELIDSFYTKHGMIDLFVAGTSTTSATLYCLINILLHYPDIQEKMAAEIKAFEADNGGDLGFNSRDDLPYCYAVVLETLRYTNIVPMSLPRETTCDTYTKGYLIPKGTQVWTNIHASHHDPVVWPDPWTFKPERFLTEDGLLISPEHKNRLNLLAFGAGVRVCVGEKLALNRLFLMIITLLRHFRFSPPAGERLVSCDPRSYKPSALICTQPYKVCVSSRKSDN